jgi:hypothetical protein
MIQCVHSVYIILSHPQAITPIVRGVFLLASFMRYHSAVQLGYVRVGKVSRQVE